jgi:sterol desaturase/sphingolipid hydroxylase (fatty acid hydroxylase superfamily)
MDWALIESLFVALMPSEATLWLLSYIIAMLVLAWWENRTPAFRTPAKRERRWPTNLSIGLINVVLATLVPVSAVLAAGWAESNAYGLLNAVTLPWFAVFAATVLIRSLAGYLFHVLMHKVPLFWRLHRVHHSDTHLDVSTAIRSHPLEYVALLLFMVPITLAFGLNPVVLAAYEIVEVAINLSGHANLRIPERADRAIRLLFVTPNMHCVHHSSWHRETDSNYGNVLSIWDRLFRTYRAAPRNGYEGLQIGLNEIREDCASNLVWQLKSPLFDIKAPKKGENKPSSLSPQGD